MIQVPAAVMARLGPYLGRLAQSRPDIWAKLQGVLTRTGAAVSGKVDDVIKYVKENPLNAALVVSTLASLGVTVSDLFSADDKKDGAVRAGVAQLEIMALQAAGVPTDGIEKIMGAAAKSEELKGLAGNEVDLATLARILGWARGHYGSISAARNAHALNQAFFELSAEDVEIGFRRLNLL